MDRSISKRKIIDPHKFMEKIKILFLIIDWHKLVEKNKNNISYSILLKF